MLYLDFFAAGVFFCFFLQVKSIPVVPKKSHDLSKPAVEQCTKNWCPLSFFYLQVKSVPMSQLFSHNLSNLLEQDEKGGIHTVDASEIQQQLRLEVYTG